MQLHKTGNYLVVLLILSLILSSSISQVAAQQSGTKADSRLKVEFSFDKNPSTAGNYLTGGSGSVSFTVTVLAKDKIRISEYGIQFDWQEQKQFPGEAGEIGELQPNQQQVLPKVNFKVITTIPNTQATYDYTIYVAYDYWESSFGLLGSWHSTSIESKGKIVVKSTDLTEKELIQRVISDVGQLNDRISALSSRMSSLGTEINNIELRLQRLNSTLVQNTSNISKDISTINQQINQIKNEFESQSQLVNTNLELARNEAKSQHNEFATAMNSVQNSTGQIQNTISNDGFLVNLSADQLNQLQSSIMSSLTQNIFWLALFISIPLSIGLSVIETLLTVKVILKRKEKKKEED